MNLQYKRLVILLLFILTTTVIAEDNFGEIKDQEGKDAEPDSTTEWGGTVYNLPENSISVDYGTKSSDYNGLDGKLIFSEYKKIVEGEFDVSESGEYVIGNLELDLEKGSSVSFKDGKLKVKDPGNMIDSTDVGFVNPEEGWEQNQIELSGEGVEYMGLTTVGLDSHGYFLEDAQGVDFGDFKVYSKGKVYFFRDDNARPNTEIDGAYISIAPEQGKFTIGSNSFKNSVSVKPRKDNNYGLKHDLDSDHVAFKSIGANEPSYITVKDRTGKGLVPKVETKGYFVIDNDKKSVYKGEGEKIYVTYKKNEITEFDKGDTQSPIEISFTDMKDKSNKKIDYDGAMIMGNDDAMAYGLDPNYVLAGKYSSTELRHGASNLLAYNYYDGGAKEFQDFFGVKVYGSSVSTIDDPKNGKFLMDILFQTPQAYRKYLKSIDLASRADGGAMAWGSPTWIQLGIGNGAFEERTIAHELGHVFDFNMGSLVDRSIGRSGVPVIRGAYSSTGTERYSTFLEQRFSPLDSYWKRYYDGNKQVQRSIAAFTVAKGMTFYQGKRILEAIGAGEINSMEDVKQII